MRLPERAGRVRSCGMMDDFDDGVSTSEESNGSSKIGLIAVFIGILGIVVGATGIILANKAQDQVRTLEAKLAAKPDKSSAIEEQVAGLDERLVKLGGEFVKLGRQDRQIQENTQAAFNQVTGDIRANREGLNELGTKMTELVEKLDNWSPTARTVTAPAESSTTPEESAAVEVAPGDGTIYNIKSGDTLSKVAKEFGVSLSALLAANPSVNPNRLQIGQPIVIPAQ